MSSCWRGATSGVGAQPRHPCSKNLNQIRSAPQAALEAYSPAACGARASSTAREARSRHAELDKSLIVVHSLFRMPDDATPFVRDPDGCAPPARTAWARGQLEEQLAALKSLSDAGLQMALGIAREATDPPAEGAAPDLARLTTAYARAARAVRMTVALQSKLIEQIGKLEEARPDLAAKRKAHIRRTVQRAIARTQPGPEESLRLETDLAERLEEETLYGDLLSRPVSEVVDEICQDLGLPHDDPRVIKISWMEPERAGPGHDIASQGAVGEASLPEPRPPP